MIVEREDEQKTLNNGGAQRHGSSQPESVILEEKKVLDQLNEANTPKLQ